MTRGIAMRGSLGLLVIAFAIPASALAQGDPAPRGGAGTNLPGAAGAAAAATRDVRSASTGSATVGEGTAGSSGAAPSWAERRQPQPGLTREGPISPHEARRLLDAILERRGAAGGSAAASWYSSPGGAGVVRISHQPGPNSTIPTRWPNDPGGCLGMYQAMWGPQAGWAPSVVVAASGCQDGAWSRGENAWNNRTPSRIGRGDAYDPRMYWGSPNGSGMGYSQRSGGFSRAYADAGLKLDVTPNDARVYVDGFYAGQVADFDGQIRRLPLNPGPHRVEFVANGLDPLVISAEVADGQTATFTGQLTRKK